jgi:hypothetical protein
MDDWAWMNQVLGGISPVNVSALMTLPVRGHSVEVELVALDVLHHDARLVVVIGRQ